MTTEDMAALVLPWAKENEPRAYELTVRIAGKPKKFRSYVVRLIELRYESDLQFRLECPLRVLELTSLRQRMRLRESGAVIEVAGIGADGERRWGFAELACMLEDGERPEDRMELKEKWDLVIDDPTPRRSR